MTNLVERIRQNTLLIVLLAIVIALVVATVLLYMGWSSVEAEQSDLNADLRRAQSNLVAAQDQYDVAKLQADLAALEANPSFPPSVSVVELSAFLAAGAEGKGVTIAKVTPASSSSVALEITGSWSKMNSFLTYLETGQFPTLNLSGLSFTQTGGKFTLTIATRP